MDKNSLLLELLDLAKQKGIKQKELAARAGLSPESISRAKHSGDMHLSSLERLASCVGLKLCFCPQEPVIARINQASLFD